MCTLNNYGLNSRVIIDQLSHRKKTQNGSESRGLNRSHDHTNIFWMFVFSVQFWRFCRHILDVCLLRLLFFAHFTGQILIKVSERLPGLGAVLFTCSPVLTQTFWDFQTCKEPESLKPKESVTVRRQILPDQELWNTNHQISHCFGVVTRPSWSALQTGNERRAALTPDWELRAPCQRVEVHSNSLGHHDLLHHRERVLPSPQKVSAVQTLSVCLFSTFLFVCVNFWLLSFFFFFKIQKK